MNVRPCVNLGDQRGWKHMVHGIQVVPCRAADAVALVGMSCAWACAEVCLGLHFSSCSLRPEVFPWDQAHRLQI